MFGISTLLRNMFMARLHQHRESIIKKAIELFIPPNVSINVVDLREFMNEEADRVYDIADYSILDERILRAKYTFWATIIPVALIIGLIFAFIPHTSPIIFVTPFFGAISTWINSIGTVHISYDERILGGMKSAIGRYFKQLAKNGIAEEKKQECVCSQAAIIQHLQLSLEQQSKQIATLTAELHEHCSIDMKCSAPVMIAEDEWHPLPEIRIHYAPC